MNNTRTKFSEIVLLHSIGVLMIFFGHVAQRMQLNALGELLITGVPLFLFVSGFLAGHKENGFNLLWLKRKTIRILLPYYLLLFVIFILFLFYGKDSFIPKQWIVLATNTQGLTNFVFGNDLTGYYSPLSQGLGHFWFVTVIMLCFLLTPIVNCAYENLPLIRKHWKQIFVVSFFILQPLLLYYNLYIYCFNVFFLGFFISKSKTKINSILFAKATVAFVLLVGLRLAGRYVLDDTFIYNKFISGMGSIAVGLWIVAFIFYIRSKAPRMIDNIADSRMILWLDSIIYDIFLVHHIIVKGEWSLFNYVANVPMALFLSIIITLIISIILHRLTLLIIKISTKTY